MDPTSKEGRRFLGLDRQDTKFSRASQEQRIMTKEQPIISPKCFEE